MLKSVRINPEREQDLYEFFETHGLKPGINKLWEFYQNNKNLESVIEKALSNLQMMGPITPRPKHEDKPTGQQVSKAGMALFGSTKAK